MEVRIPYTILMRFAKTTPALTVLLLDTKKLLGCGMLPAGKIRRCSRNRGEPLHQFFRSPLLDQIERRFPFIAAAAFKPDGDLVVLGVRDETVALWRLTTVPQKK